MGIFRAANQWFAILLFLPGILNSVVLPILSGQLGQNDTKQSVKTLVMTMKMNIFIVIPLVVLLCGVSPYIMKLYGVGFSDSWPTLVVVLLTAGLVALQTSVGQIIVASGRMWIGFAMNMGWAVAFIVSMIILVDFGALGLALSRMLAYVIHSLWVVIFAFWFNRKRV